MLSTLRRRVAPLDGGEGSELALFFKSGFEEERLERAERTGNVRLVTLRDVRTVGWVRVPRAARVFTHVWCMSKFFI